MSRSHTAVVVSADELPHFLTVEQAAAVLGLGRTNAYEAIRRGQVPSVRFGRRIRVPRAALLALGLVQAAAQESVT